MENFRKSPVSIDSPLNTFLMYRVTEKNMSDKWMTDICSVNVYKIQIYYMKKVYVLFIERFGK